MPPHGIASNQVHGLPEPQSTDRFVRHGLQATLAFLLAFPAFPAIAQTLNGQIVGITDGDTLTLLSDRVQYKIRLAAIDTPEKAQPFGSRSQENLSRLAFQKQATADCPKRDRWGRLVCTVFVNGQDVGLQQVADGMAWWFRRYASEQSPADRTAHEQAEGQDQAKAYRVMG